MPTIRISQNRYEGLNKSKLLFLAKRTYTNEGDNGEIHYSYYWYSTDRTIEAFISGAGFGDTSKDCEMIVVDDKVQYTEEELDEMAARGIDVSKFINDENSPEQFVVVNVHVPDPHNVNDWIHIINSSCYHSNDLSGEYAYGELIWFLANKEWEARQFLQALSCYKEEFITPFVKKLFNIARFFSYKVQQRIKDVLAHYGLNYEPSLSAQITEAFMSVNKTSANVDQTLFDLIDRTIYKDIDKGEYNVYEEVSTNPFLLLIKWLNNSKEALTDYNILNIIYSYVDKSVQLNVIRRYFYDIKERRTSFDKVLIEKFKKNEYAKVSVYRYCITNPCNKIDVAPVLLCDCIISILDSRGSRFQNYNGILDLTIKNINPNNPNVDFGLQKFLPSCNRGAVANVEQFKGFFDYSLWYVINEERLNDEKCLKKISQALLEEYGKREILYKCTLQNEYKDRTELVKCQSLFKSKDHKALDCGYFEKEITGYWLIEANDQNKNILEMMMVIPEANKGIIRVSLDMVSLEKLTNSIKELILSLSEETNKNMFLISNYKVKLYKRIISSFIIPKKVRIIPRKTSYIGKEFDVFKLWSKALLQVPPVPEERIKILESQEVTKRVIASLEKKLQQTFNGNFFEIEYNWYAFNSLQKEYYYLDEIKEDDKDEAFQFLKRGHHSDYLPLCSPKLSDVNNPATDIPYFWCMGKECFQNALENQVISCTNSWRDYTLLHILEIIGYKKVKETVAGYEPDESVRIFIHTANKAMKKFNRLKCRECGHLLFSTSQNSFNSYSYYKCANPICSEHNKEVYLSYCFKCKKGLIDSRDTKQCPNKMYVCPTCLSCCDDNLYERLAQRYILQHYPVPSYLEEKRGNGHNNKNIYYCPLCGQQLPNVIVKEGKEYRKCTNCDYEIELQK